MNALNELFPPYPLPPANHAGVYEDARRIEIYYQPYGACAWIILEYVWDGQQGCVTYSYSINAYGIGQSASGHCSIGWSVQGEEAFKEKIITKLDALEEIFKQAIQQAEDKSPTHLRRALKALGAFRARFAPKVGQQVAMF